MPRVFMGPQCEKKPKIQILFRAEDGDNMEDGVGRTELAGHVDSYSPPGTPCSAPDGLSGERSPSPGRVRGPSPGSDASTTHESDASPIHDGTSPTPAAESEGEAEGEVTSTTSTTSPVPIEIVPQGDRELKVTGRSAFRRISAENCSKECCSEKEDRHDRLKDYLSEKARQQEYEDHIRLLHYPLIPPPSQRREPPSPPKSHYYPAHTTHPAHITRPSHLTHLTHPVVPLREHDPLMMARYELPYLSLPHSPLPRLDMLGYTDPRMPITNYYLTAARMRYESHHQAMMTALSRAGSLTRREDHRVFSPTLSPRKSEIDTVKTPLSDRHHRSSSHSESVSSPESLSGVQDLSRKRKYSGDHQRDLEESSHLTLSPTWSSPRDSARSETLRDSARSELLRDSTRSELLRESTRFHLQSSRKSHLPTPRLSLVDPLALSLAHHTLPTPPTSAAAPMSPPGHSPLHPAGRHPLHPGLPCPLEARYNRPITPPSFSMIPTATSTPIHAQPAPSHPGLSPGHLSAGQPGHHSHHSHHSHHPGVSGLYFPGMTGSRHRDPSKPPALKKYKCDTCGKAFSRSNTLVTHKRIHTGEKPFKCEMCGRAFRQPGNLTRHRLTHTTVKPYVCPVCKKAFNRASNLHTHMRTHTNYRPFVCGYCGKGFHQKIDLKIHTYTHTGHSLPSRSNDSLEETARS